MASKKPVNKIIQPYKKIFKKIKAFLLPVLLFIVLIGLIFTAYQLILSDKFYPLTFFGDTNVTFLTKGQASRILSAKLQDRLKQTLQFSFQPLASEEAKTFTIYLSSASADIDYSKLDTVFNTQHNYNYLSRFYEQLKALVQNQPVDLNTNINLDQQINQIGQTVSQPFQNAILTYDETTNAEGTPSANIQIKDGENGIALDEDLLKQQVEGFINFGKYNNNLPVKSVPPKIGTGYLEKVKTVLLSLQGKPIKMHFEDQTWTLDPKQLLTILDLKEGANLLQKDQTYDYIGKIASDIDQKVQEGQFVFDPNSKRVSVFSPSREGRKLDQDQTFNLITDALNNQTTDITLPVNVVKPKVETSQVNNLGIKGLIGRGISNFAGSIPNRIYNVKLTAQKINGVLVAPGEVFSFNQTVGDISAATGYKQAYVIKEGRTVLDDGGGVCQDSTTLFRAVLNAGLPVVARTAHAYRVGYYEQGFPPGLDATVFYPTVDFQFKNDTPNHILIQAYTVGLTLYVDLYGTSDGRTVNLTNPIITNITPAPPDLRQDDPTLPKGTVKQVDFAARGATVIFRRTVTKSGETLLNERWTSNYKPWQAVYLVGIGG